MPKITMVSLGCAKNMVDAETALASVLENGYELALDPAEADVVLINTCGFIESARAEAREVIAEYAALKRQSGNRQKIAVMGCLAQRSPDAVAADFPQVDAIWGLGILPVLPEAVDRLVAAAAVEKAGFQRLAAPHAGPRLVSTLPSYAYLKISDGCDNRCAYCSIPDIRGPLRSRPMADIVEEAKLLEDQGIKELVVISQDTTLYGRDLADGASNILTLLDKLLAAVRVPRLRLLYAHPAHIDDTLLALLAEEPRLCGYLDIPFQHVSDSVLAAMGRGYGKERVYAIVERFNSDNLTLRTTLMTGFPGETERDFEEMLDLVNTGRIHHLGGFVFSPEQDTPAFALPNQVPAAEAEQRLDAILTSQRRNAFAWLDSRVGGREQVLLDRFVGKGILEGRTVREAPDADGIVAVVSSRHQPGQIVDACIDARDAYDLIASPAALPARGKTRGKRSGGNRRRG